MRMRAYVVGASLALSLSGGAFAQTDGCQILDGWICGRTPATAVLSSVRGNVLVGAGGGFSQGVAGQRLFTGNRVVTNNGSAQVTLAPTCQVNLPSQTTRTIGERDGLACLIPEDGRPPALPPQAGMNFVPLVIGGGALLVGGILLSQSDSDKSP